MRAPGVQARGGALEAAASARLLVLDVDGVLLDPRPSFYAVAREVAGWAASRALRRPVSAGLTLDDVAAFKAVGGFNDDFDMACGAAWALVARDSLPESPAVAAAAAWSAGAGVRGLMSAVEARLPEPVRARAREACAPATVRPRCQARYAGRARCREVYGLDPDVHADVPAQGLWPLETVLCDVGLLRDAGAIALFTGRCPGEARLALDLLSIEVPAPLMVVDDGSCARKPAPDGLVRLGRDLRVPMLFAGDTVDDQRAAQAYRERADAHGLPPLHFARVAAPGADAGIDRALDSGADIVTSGLDALLHALRGKAWRNP